MTAATFLSGMNSAPGQIPGIQSSHCTHRTPRGMGMQHRPLRTEMKSTIRGRSAPAQATRQGSCWARSHLLQASRGPSHSPGNHSRPSHRRMSRANSLSSPYCSCWGCFSGQQAMLCGGRPFQKAW